VDDHAGTDPISSKAGWEACCLSSTSNWQRAGTPRGYAANATALPAISRRTLCYRPAPGWGGLDSGS